MVVMKKLIFIITLLVLLIPTVMAVPMPPMPNVNFSVAISTDLANGTYTKYIMGNAMTTGNLSIWDIVYGTYKPWGDGWVMATGMQEMFYLFPLIGWLLFLFAIMVMTESTLMPVILGIVTASYMAMLIPAIAMPILTVMFAFCIAAAIYKLFIDR